MQTAYGLEYCIKHDKQKAILKEKKLKIWNGRGFYHRKTNKNYDHVYVCAKTIKQVIEICHKAGYETLNRKEIASYWSKDCWGNTMIDVIPEVGVWVTEEKMSEAVRLV